jgi:ribosomal protection tetracycline resistance protein
MKITNIGIVAHVDAGKTSLTERILYETHVIDEIGRVDKGNTQTDSMELEKRRGITIKASVVSFFVNDLKINLIDTPGHADFIAEVERSFGVLDGAILVISAVEGIQAQTKILMAILTKLAIPTIIFVNKIDRSGAQSDEIVESIKEKLTENVVPLYSVENIGTKQAFIVENSFDRDRDQDFLEACLELVSLHDDHLLEAYVNGEAITAEQVKKALTKQTRDARIYPIFFGSAIMGVGVTELLAGVATLFPMNTAAEEAPLSGVVFKIEKEASGEKIAYIRVFSGSINVREYVPLQRKKSNGEVETYTDKIKKLHAFCEGKTVQSQKVETGEFCKVWGLKDVKIGDVVGEWSDNIKYVHFADPQIETRIEARQEEENHQLYLALTELSEEDPLVQVLHDNFHNELYIRLFGEVQKEVIEALLKENYGLDVQFSETRIVCIEKPAAVGQALDVIGAADNPFAATIGFRVEPGPTGSGVTYRLEVKLGELPLSFHKAIEEAAFDTLKQGLYGWEVTDTIVTLTHTGYSSPVSTAGDFRKLAPLVLMEALSQAGMDVYEPINQFELRVPVNTISKAMFKLSVLKATFEKPILHNDTFLLTGTLPVATTEEFKRGLHSFTEGEGVFIAKPAGFSKIEGEFPTRKRMDYNPLNRKDYLLHILHTY